MKLEAMPRLIKPRELSKSYVEYVREQLTPLLGTDAVTKLPLDGDQLNLVKFSPTQGTYFTLDDKGNINFLYHYQTVHFLGVPQASEALAYKWGTAPFVMKDTFFKYMLPSLGFIITDSEYTPDGARWFRNQYDFAFKKGCDIYILDMVRQRMTLLTKSDFDTLVPMYWGRGERFTRWRFAIKENK